MYGVVTRNEEELAWSEFDRGFFEAKSVSGRAAPPQADAVNMVSCHADNAATRENPALLPVSEDGERATREQPYFDWNYVCPTHEGYRAGLLETVEDCAEVSPDVRLDDVGFPRPEYCRCDRCEERFAESEYDDRFAWRASVVEEFVREARERVPGRLYLTLYPDPYPGPLSERAGLDVEALAEHVDEFVVPLYDVHYGTTYWLETIAKGFRSLLEPFDVPFAIELYAVDAEMEMDDLIHATEVAEAYADEVYFGYDASNAAAALRRKRADQQEGVTHRPGDEN